MPDQLYELQMVRIAGDTQGYSRRCTHAEIHQIPPPPAPQDPVPATITTWTASAHVAGDQIFAQWTFPTDEGDIITEWQVMTL